MPKLEESLNQISLRDILDSSEIDILKKNSLFNNLDESEDNFDKDELLLKFVSLAIEKFKQFKENILVKCFNWVQSELQKMNIELKPDVYSLNKIENLENSKPSMKMKLGWLKEYSTLNKENPIFTMIGKNAQKFFHRYSVSPGIKAFSFNPIKVGKKLKSSKRKSVNEDFSKSNLLMKLNGGGPNLKLESDKFNIFEFEKKNRKK